MRYFTIAELSHSTTAEQEQISNIPTAEAVANLRRLIDGVLNPARVQFGAPIYVNSGYRSPELNRRVGGARRSYHMEGRAADIDSRTGRNRELYEILRRLPHRELIWEKGGAWIHVAL